MKGAELVVESGVPRLLASLEDLRFGTATLVVHVRDGRVVRIEVARNESIEQAGGSP